MLTLRTPTAAALMLAALADCDPRTAARYLRGERRLSVRVAERIVAVLAAHPEIECASASRPMRSSRKRAA